MQNYFIFRCKSQNSINQVDEHLILRLNMHYFNFPPIHSSRSIIGVAS